MHRWSSCIHTTGHTSSLPAIIGLRLTPTISCMPMISSTAHSLSTCLCKSLLFLGAWTTLQPQSPHCTQTLHPCSSTIYVLLCFTAVFFTAANQRRVTRAKLEREAIVGYLSGIGYLLAFMSGNVVTVLSFAPRLCLEPSHLTSTHFKQNGTISSSVAWTLSYWLLANATMTSPPFYVFQPTTSNHPILLHWFADGWLRTCPPWCFMSVATLQRHNPTWLPCGPYFIPQHTNCSKTSAQLMQAWTTKLEHAQPCPNCWCPANGVYTSQSKKWFLTCWATQRLILHIPSTNSTSTIWLLDSRAPNRLMAHTSLPSKPQRHLQFSSSLKKAFKLALTPTTTSDSLSSILPPVMIILFAATIYKVGPSTSTQLVSHAFRHPKQHSKLPETFPSYRSIHAQLRFDSKSWQQLPGKYHIWWDREFHRLQKMPTNAVSYFCFCSSLGLISTNCFPALSAAPAGPKPLTLGLLVSLLHYHHLLHVLPPWVLNIGHNVHCISSTTSTTWGSLTPQLLIANSVAILMNCTASPTPQPWNMVHLLGNLIPTLTSAAIKPTT